MKDGLTLKNIDVKVKVPSLRAFLKFGFFSLHVFCFLTLHSLIFLLVRNEKKRLRLFVKSNSLHARIAMKYLGLESFHEEGPKVRGKIIVCNHMSYVDVLVLFTLYPSLFITSKEIEQTPVLGQITKLAGCFFVERRKNLRTPQMIEEEMRLMRKRLAEGFNIFLFPEGTSTDGKSLLPFKAHFFQLAVDTGAIIQPLFLKYTGINRDVAPWYGDMTFVPHFMNLCSEKNISMAIDVLPRVSPDGKDKYQLKDECFELIKRAHEKY